MFNDGKTINELKKAYRKLVMEYHSDRPNGDSEKFTEINGAYEQRFDEVESGMIDEEADKVNIDDSYRDRISRQLDLG